MLLHFDPFHLLQPELKSQLFLSVLLCSALLLHRGHMGEVKENVINIPRQAFQICLGLFSVSGSTAVDTDRTPNPEQKHTFLLKDL